MFFFNSVHGFDIFNSTVQKPQSFTITLHTYFYMNPILLSIGTNLIEECNSCLRIIVLLLPPSSVMMFNLFLKTLHVQGTTS